MKRTYKIFFIAELLAVVAIVTQASACTGPTIKSDTNSILTQEIKRQLQEEHLSLYYPRSVEWFYTQNKFQPAWIKPQDGEGPAWQAMLMIDCAIQFGLMAGDYHSAELTYPQLHSLIDSGLNADVSKQARYEIMLTDAMITFINNLHFGKLNPDYPAMKIDQLNSQSFNADVFLINALKQKDLMTGVASAQPTGEEYRDLQNHMRLLAGTYQGDCYEIPESDIRKMAINMERLRWQYTTGKPIHLTCLVKDGVIVYYEDIDQQDKALEDALYSSINKLP